jgi:predicted RNA binding protein YcfA (HicA-like mRNA interferase family)
VKPEIWARLKNLSCDDIIKLLKDDEWFLARENGTLRTYRSKNGRQVTIHYHPKKNYGHDLFRKLINEIGWTEQDLKRLKLIH